MKMESEELAYRRDTSWQCKLIVKIEDILVIWSEALFACYSDHPTIVETLENSVACN